MQEKELNNNNDGERAEVIAALFLGKEVVEKCWTSIWKMSIKHSKIYETSIWEMLTKYLENFHQAFGKI